MKVTSNSIKREILSVLEKKDYPEFVHNLQSYPLKKVIGPLFSGLNSHKERVRWHAIAGFGEVVKTICKEDPEYGRTFIRKLIWMSSDESGGIPWGVPEVMGEVLSKVDFLAREYFSMLIYQIIDIPGRPDIFLEHPPLRRGGYWGVARFSLEYPEIVKGHLKEIQSSFEKEEDMFIKLMGMLIFENISYVWKDAEKFLNTNEKIRVFWKYRFKDFLVGEVAQNLLTQGG